MSPRLPTPNCRYHSFCTRTQTIRNTIPVSIDFFRHPSRFSALRDSATLCPLGEWREPRPVRLEPAKRQKSYPKPPRLCAAVWGDCQPDATRMPRRREAEIWRTYFTTGRIEIRRRADAPLVIEIHQSAAHRPRTAEHHRRTGGRNLADRRLRVDAPGRSHANRHVRSGPKDQKAHAENQRNPPQPLPMQFQALRHLFSGPIRNQDASRPSTMSRAKPQPQSNTRPPSSVRRAFARRRRFR